MAHALVKNFCDEPAAQLKPEQLPFVKQISVVPIAPAVQSVRFVAGKDLLIWHEARLQSLPARCRRVGAGKIFRIRFFEKSAGVSVSAVWVVVLDCNHAVSGGTRLRARVTIEISTVGAHTSIAASWADFGELCSTASAFTRSIKVANFVELPAARADYDVHWMARIFSQKIAGE